MDFSGYEDSLFTPLTPELNPSAQRFLLKFFTGDFNFKGLTALRVY
jgi:hypothetical protein